MVVIRQRLAQLQVPRDSDAVRLERFRNGHNTYEHHGPPRFSRKCIACNHSIRWAYDLCMTCFDSELFLAHCRELEVQRTEDK